MIIKVCKGCGKLTNTGPHNASGWIEYKCNRCLNLPPYTPHPKHELVKPLSMIAQLRRSIRAAA